MSQTISLSPTKMSNESINVKINKKSLGTQNFYILVIFSLQNMRLQ